MLYDVMAIFGNITSDFLERRSDFIWDSQDQLVAWLMLWKRLSLRTRPGVY
jgi:hypothetical protein